MTYYQEAKDLYDAYHDAMGDWTRPPFEHLTTREMEAWQIATGHTTDLEEKVSQAQEDVRDIESELQEAEEDLARFRRDYKWLEDSIPLGVISLNVGECR